jgi:hypothetical protein
MRTTSWRIGMVLPALILAWLLLCPAVQSQTIQHLDSGYHYDPAFRFGTLGFPYGQVCHLYDSLHLDFVNIYGEVTDLNNYLDSTRWTNPWWDSLRRTFYRNAAACGIKLSITPGLLHYLDAETWSRDNYFDFQSPPVITADFAIKGTPNATVPLLAHPIWGGTFSQGTPSDSYLSANLIATGSHYSSDGLKLTNADVYQ